MKLDMSGSAVTARLQEASDLLDVCRALASAGQSGSSADLDAHVQR